jgi:hypothetical protein
MPRKRAQICVDRRPSPWPTASEKRKNDENQWKQYVRRVRRLPNRRRKPRASPDRSRRRINGVEKCPNRNKRPQGRDRNESLTTVRSRTGEIRPRKRPRCRTLTLDVYWKDGGRAWTECRENSDGASVATSENGGKNRSQVRTARGSPALHKEHASCMSRSVLMRKLINVICVNLHAKQVKS